MPSLPPLPPGAAKALLVAVRMLPLLVIVCLSAPAWVSWPFLSAPRQQVVLDMVKALGAWVGVAESAEEKEPEALPPPEKEKPRLPPA
ncbi:hypothetical protein [Streptomyces sp. NPDC094149]|uniref:hypothetical protein n=1 Tax=Streptomyces sp. NPDC094149 TaxID=3155079 RepID=UPI00332C19CE